MCYYICSFNCNHIEWFKVYECKCDNHIENVFEPININKICDPCSIITPDATPNVSRNSSTRTTISFIIENVNQ